MWYIYHGMTFPGYHVAQTAREVGLWAEQKAGPFPTWQEANRVLAAQFPAAFNTPYVPPPARPRPLGLHLTQEQIDLLRARAAGG